MPQKERLPMPCRARADLERRLLQGAVGVAALIPILVGLAGILAGLGAFAASLGASLNADSHLRYLSGLTQLEQLGVFFAILREVG
jgi:hypothetical protein